MKLRRRELDEFLPTLVYIFTMAQWFGIPTYGGATALVFAVVMLFMLVALEMGAIWKLVRLLTGWAMNTTDGRGLVGRLSGTIFYGNAVLSLILSWKLVSSWKEISCHWIRAERTEGMYFPPESSIKLRIVVVTTFLTLCACVEHILSMISATGFDIPPEEYFQRYVLSSHGFLLQPYEYSIWLAVPIFILSKTATILWNFQDLIIILVSMGLSSRYRRMNTYLRHLVKVEMNNDVEKFGSELYAQVQVWRRLRSAYVRQSQLVRMVDCKIGPLILLSNMNNFYFICLQLFLGINKDADKGSIIHRLYYFFSLGWLMFRACSVVLAAAEVHHQSKLALPFLFGCPASSYNIEVKRLKNQLAHEWVALSGMGFFYLNRQLLLEVAAAILKYELVLIQFDRP